MMWNLGEPCEPSILALSELKNYCAWHMYAGILHASNIGFGGGASEAACVLGRAVSIVLCQNALQLEFYML